MEVQLEAVEAELAALIGEPLRMTAFHGVPPHASTQAAEELQNGQPNSDHAQGCITPTTRQSCAPPPAGSALHKELRHSVRAEVEDVVDDLLPKSRMQRSREVHDIRRHLLLPQ